MTPTAPSSRPRLRLDFLDGIRGFTALYVAVYHIAGVLSQLYGGVHGPWRYVASVFNYGYDAVGIFIVLSGYCLMLPAARNPQGAYLPDGVKSYFERRAWRILPPYYAALAIALFLNYFAYHAKLHTAHPYPLAHYGFSAPNLLSHLFLVHNFSPVYIDLIDPPMWSIGIEAQIYFLLPFLFLPLLRRFGIWSIVAAGLLIGIAPHFLLPKDGNLDWSCPWFIGLFAMGCAAATLTLSTSKSTRWEAVAGFALLMASLFLTFFHRLIPGSEVLIRQTLVGAWAALFLLTLAQHAIQRDTVDIAAMLRLLESRPAMSLGAFSYSLYLIHVPIESKLVYILSQHFNQSTTTTLAYCVALPLAIAGAYCFYLLVERPTIKYRARLHSRSQRQVQEVRASSA